jgi:hypothetical protein
MSRRDLSLIRGLNVGEGTEGMGSSLEKKSYYRKEKKMSNLNSINFRG